MKLSNSALKIVTRNRKSKSPKLTGNKSCFDNGKKMFKLSIEKGIMVKSLSLFIFIYAYLEYVNISCIDTCGLKYKKTHFLKFEVREMLKIAISRTFKMVGSFRYTN